MSSIYGPKHTDQEAASSAHPDTEALPRWDDEGWDQYLFAVDLGYRIEWELTHGVAPEDVQAMIDEWNEWHGEGEDQEED